MRISPFRTTVMGYATALALALAAAWSNGYSMFGTSGNAVKRSPDGPKKGGVGYIRRGPLHK